jgi:hypothetical protein
MLAVNTVSSTAAKTLRLLTAYVQNDTAKAGAVSKSASALVLLGVRAQVHSISTAPISGQGNGSFKTGFASVQDEWNYAVNNVRKGNHIDGRVFEKLTDAIMANRDKFPPGEFSIKISWPDGASVEETIPAMASITVSSVSIGAAFAQTTTYGQSLRSGSFASAQAHYREWQ